MAWPASRYSLEVGGIKMPPPVLRVRMVPLPIDSYLPEIVSRLRESRALVLVAPPGAGKTTRVPPAVLAARLLPREHPNLVMLQPRRVAARAAALRIAQENGWTLGQEAGYHVRFDRRIGPQTRLRVLTEGILTRQLVDDPLLEGVGGVVLDEFHERSLHTDIALGLLREVQQSVRDDLILIVMSATLEAEPVARFLGDCPVVRAEGRMYPITISHAPAPAATATARRRALPEHVVDVVRQVLDEKTPDRTPDAGDILVFLPGVEEIRRTMQRLEPLAQQHDLLPLPLHGSLPAEDQIAALEPAEQRKVILATNIAETSLTIDGVRTVIDSGLARVAAYDPQRGLDRLELKRISRASATQRAGRAGRTAPGRCIRLWSAREDRFLQEFELPEVRRVDLCSTVLSLHAWGQSDVRRFGWYEAPPEQTLVAAERLLAMLGALSAEVDGRITPLGRRMLALPVHPRLARLLIAAADQGLLRQGATIAALLSEKDIVYMAPQDRGAIGGRSTAQGPSDLLHRLDLLAQAERSGFGREGGGPQNPHSLRQAGIDPVAARHVGRTRDELLRIARRVGDSRRAEREASEEDLLKLPLWAYPDRVCRRRGSDRQAAVMVGGGGVRLGPESVVHQAEFFLALDARQDERSLTREAMVRVASAVQPEWLEGMFLGQIRRERKAVFDTERQRVVGLGTVSYRDLVLREDREAVVEPEQAGAVLGEALRPQAAGLFAADEAASSYLARVAFARQWMPEHAWPQFTDEELADLLVSACHGKRSVEEVRRVPLVTLLKSRLQYPLDRTLEEQVPEAIAVPSGSRIRLAYAAGRAPVLAVRLQEVFGWTDTPRLAAGRAPVLLHLLGPNFRPVQITDDLRSFWSTTYFQVRKDLRIRYPRHSWPENPLEAKPEAKGGRRQR